MPGILANSVMEDHLMQFLLLISYSVFICTCPLVRIILLNKDIWAHKDIWISAF